MTPILKPLKEWATNLKPELFKNISPDKLAGIIAVVTAGILLALSALIFVYLKTYNIVIFLFLLIVLVPVLIYFLVRYLIQYFIYRRIKLIYKLISDTKLQDADVSSYRTHDLQSLEHAELDAINWIQKKNLEILHIKEMESFRREYIGNVSHELKTPIFNIQAYIQTVLDDEMADQQIALSFLNKALKNASRLQEIIEDLSIVYKLESGEKVLAPEKFNIKELADEVLEDHQSLADQKQIKLMFKAGADEDHLVYADKEYIRIALSNLVHNGIKYGKYNGFVKISIYTLDKKILIEVSDNGIGISEEHLPHVFERFYRVDKSRSREQGGSGLGLSIVKHIADAHHQTLHVRSKEGAGTTFGFTLELERSN